MIYVNTHVFSVKIATEREFIIVSRETSNSTHRAFVLTKKMKLSHYNIA